MLRTALVVGWLVSISSVVGLADDPPIFSGPQPGEKITPFKVQGVYEDERGQEFDFVSMAGDRPFMLIFIHTSTRPAGDLTRVLLHFAQMRKEAGLFTALTYLSDDITQAEKDMLLAYGWWNCGPPSGISLDGAEGPGAYGLNRNVTMTILIGKEKTVTENFAIVQPSDSDAVRILPSVTELVGGTVPSVPEVQFLSSPSLLPPIEKMWQEGKTPTDLKLREMFCRVLRVGDDAEQAAKIFAEMNAYAEGNADLQAELGETSRLLLNRTYGSRPPIAGLVPELNEQLKSWEKQYFAPEILAGQ